jgi:hypothetical protein
MLASSCFTAQKTKVEIVDAFGILYEKYNSSINGKFNAMRLSKLFVLGIFFVFFVAACGSDSNDPVPTTAPPTSIPATLVPTLTATLFPTATAIPTLIPPTDQPAFTPQPTIQVLIEAEEGQAIDPPIRIAIPEDWEQVNRMHVYQEVDSSLHLVPVTLYTGPVTNGQGFIFLLWAFENVVDFNPISGSAGELNLHGDGLRLLRLALIEPDCVIGAYDEQQFEVGGLPATGAPFSVVGCSSSVDTRGWFAVLQQHNVNLAFYTFTEPLEALGGNARSELQNILDSVTFHVDEMLLTPTTGDGE